jgi:uncharacterized membrane protein YgcG
VAAVAVTPVAALEAVVAAASDRACRKRPECFRRPVLLCLLTLAGLLAALPARPQQLPEIIELFRSEISVAPDASVNIHETIRVRAAGASIRHGIFRDFPTRYRDRFGNQVKVGFRVSEVLRDGAPEPYQLEPLQNGVRIRIGRADFDLSPGEYTYDISYTTNRQIGFFADHDELYWNVTGNGWAFPIERAEARVSLPAGVARDAVRVEGYTGPAGAKSQDYQGRVAEDGAAEFETTRPLAPRNGLTVVVAWPKGAVTAPTFPDRLRYFFSDNRTAFVAFAGMIVLLAYYLLVWSTVGRDPASGPIMVRYEPPPGLSPAGMRYLTRMGFDQTTFAAAVLNLGVKGYLKIEHDFGTYTLHRVPGAKLENISGLAPEERVLARQLLDSTDNVDLSPANYRVVQTATKATRESLRAAEEKIYFLTNSRYLAPGLGLSACVLLAALVSLPGQAVAVSAFMSLWLTGWSAGVFVLSAVTVAGWRKYSADGSTTTLVGAVVVTLFGLPFWAGEMFGMYALIHNGSVWFALLLVALIGTNVLFHYLLKAPTRAGRALLDQVEGFKRYFLAVEQDPLQRLSPPEVTTERFEKFLPYAVALGVEKAWTSRLAAALEHSGKLQTSYSPVWYMGSDIAALGPAGFASTLGSGLTAAVASASSAPGSSSGGGGGGSSGGGGGGGGGGGW